MNKQYGFILDWHGVCDWVTFSKFIETIITMVVFDDKMKQGRTEKEVVIEMIQEDADSWTLGNMTPNEFWFSLGKTFGPYMRSKKFDQEELSLLRKSILSVDPIIPMWNLVSELKRAGHVFGILSDCPLDKATVIRGFSSNWLQQFKIVRFSYEFHMDKGSPDFFHGMVAQMGIPRGDCIYVDDQEKHIKTAQLFGLKTHLFKGGGDNTPTDNFVKFLHDEGIYQSASAPT